MSRGWSPEAGGRSPLPLVGALIKIRLAENVPRRGEAPAYVRVQIVIAFYLTSLFPVMFAVQPLKFFETMMRVTGEKKAFNFFCGYRAYFLRVV